MVVLRCLAEAVPNERAGERSMCFALPAPSSFYFQDAASDGCASACKPVRWFGDDLFDLLAGRKLAIATSLAESCVPSVALSDLAEWCAEPAARTSSRFVTGRDVHPILFISRAIIIHRPSRR